MEGEEGEEGEKRDIWTLAGWGYIAAGMSKSSFICHVSLRSCWAIRDTRSAAERPDPRRAGRDPELRCEFLPAITSCLKLTCAES